MEFATQASLKRGLMPPEHVISAAPTQKCIYLYTRRRSLDAEIEQSAHVSTVWECDSAPTRGGGARGGVTALGVRWDALSREQDRMTRYFLIPRAASSWGLPFG
jgi:hypothetical protein